MAPRLRPLLRAAVAPVALMLLASACGGSDDLSVSPDGGDGASATASSVDRSGEIQTVEGMPPVIDPDNLYSEIRANNLADKVSEDAFLVYVPNERSGTVTVIDPTSYEVVDTFETGFIPQHVVPSYDMETLYALNNNGNSITPIDPLTGEPGTNIGVDDPYNLYYTPDGAYGIIVAEARERFDFVDPTTFEVDHSIQLECSGLNHVDFSIDGSFLIATCEFEAAVVKVDWRQGTYDKLVLDGSRVVRGGYQTIPMPQDVRVSPDGSKFYIADMISNGVHVIDAESFTEAGFIETGVGAHGLYPGRNGELLYVVNRGANTFDVSKGEGSVAMVDFDTDEVVETVPVPGGGSPDMGNFTPDGSELWLGGRYDAVVYVYDVDERAFSHQIPVGQGPHGLTVWPQPGRYSLGHTGNFR